MSTFVTEEDQGLYDALRSAREAGDETTDEQLLRTIRQLSPKAKAELAKRVDARMNVERKVWFCDRGRSCDGKPHDGFTYPHARGDQWPPPGMSWIVWVLRGGRGSGKTRTGSEYTRWVSKKIQHLGLIAPTGPAARTVMIEGESGIIAACERAGEPCVYEPSKQRLTFSSGARAQIFSAEEPDRIRGNQFGFVWGDEWAHWENAAEVWDMMMFALRLGDRPHVLGTTTPLPTEFVKSVLDHEDTVATGVSTHANMDNLAKSVVKRILDRYEGTYQGRQEIYGEVIDDREGSLWKSEQFHYVDIDTRVMDRVVVGIDPAGSQGKKSDLTGIIVAGKQAETLYAIDDFSGKYSPSGWARAAINAYEKYKADAIVVERNYGGDMCRATLKAEGFTGRIIEAKATDGKRLRAEPIAALYEQGESGGDAVRAYHARGGRLAKLESEMVSWIPGEGKSPNRVDAYVWCAAHLTKRGGGAKMGNPLQGSIGQAPYRGPGSPYARKQAKGARWLSR